jgi:hypothetical protein
MLKKLIVLALAAGVSASASAGYIQYEVKDAQFDDGFGLAGFFVQNTDTKGIAYAALVTDWQFYTPNTDLKVINAHITAPGVPTSFDAESTFGGGSTRLSLEFGPGTTAGTYAVQGMELDNGSGRAGGGRHSLVSGYLEAGQIDPQVLNWLLTGTSPFAEVVPPGAPAPGAGAGSGSGNVPEPASLALVAAGLGLMGRLRSRARRAS